MHVRYVQYTCSTLCDHDTHECPRGADAYIAIHANVDIIIIIIIIITAFHEYTDPQTRVYHVITYDVQQFTHARALLHFASKVTIQVVQNYRQPVQTHINAQIICVH